MNKKQLKEIGDTVVWWCLNCEMCKLFYGYQEGIKHVSKCCDQPDYLWTYYQGVEKCATCGSETMWFSECYDCNKKVCENCTEWHITELDGVVEFCRDCHQKRELEDVNREYKRQENYRIEKARIEEREKIMNELLKMDEKEIKDERIKEIVKVYRRINALFDFR